MAKCLTCQWIKAEQKKSSGFILPLEVPQWKWENLSMDFIDRLLRRKKGNEGIWVFVGTLTKSAHFIPIKSMRTTTTLATLYIKEVF